MKSLRLQGTSDRPGGLSYPPDSSIQDGKKRFGGFGIVFMEIQLVTGILARIVLPFRRAISFLQCAVFVNHTGQEIFPR